MVERHVFLGLTSHSDNHGQRSCWVCWLPLDRNGSGNITVTVDYMIHKNAKEHFRLIKPVWIDISYPSDMSSAEMLCFGRQSMQMPPLQLRLPHEAFPP